MIVSFYDEQFKGLQNNASLVVDNASFSLVQRAVELDDFKCRCEAFTENIHPTFLVLKNDKGNYLYGALAGIPQLNANNQTEITAADLKTMFKSDVLLNFSKQSVVGDNVNMLLQNVFEAWNTQVNQGSFNCELVFQDVDAISFEYLKPTAETAAVYNVWDDIFTGYLKYYGLYMSSRIDLINKKVVFVIGQSGKVSRNVKLWELGIYDYGKWIADVNEAQGIVLNTATGETEAASEVWILNSKNNITTNPALRDIYPIKRKIILKETEDANKISALKNEASQEALEELTKSMFQENLELENFIADFETKFNIYVHRGDKTPYKTLPCGELHYNASGLIKVQIGYRMTGIEFIL